MIKYLRGENDVKKKNKDIEVRIEEVKKISKVRIMKSLSYL